MIYVHIHCAFSSTQEIKPLIINGSAGAGYPGPVRKFEFSEIVEIKKMEVIDLPRHFEKQRNGNMKITNLDWGKTSL